MGQLREFENEKLIVGILYRDEAIYSEAISRLTAEFGPIDDESVRFSFSKEFSTYYDEEIGGECMRVILSFENTVDPRRQAEIKTFTNALEAELSTDGNRKINLDPGFINTGRLMLATTKPSGFRVPLDKGIYTEITLFFSEGKWQSFPWTYRDYKSEKVQEFLTRVRNKYLYERRIKNKNA